MGRGLRFSRSVAAEREVFYLQAVGAGSFGGSGFFSNCNRILIIGCTLKQFFRTFPSIDDLNTAIVT